MVMVVMATNGHSLIEYMLHFAVLRQVERLMLTLYGALQTSKSAICAEGSGTG